jgi:hypothetical protein
MGENLKGRWLRPRRDRWHLALTRRWSEPEKATVPQEILMFGLMIQIGTVVHTVFILTREQKAVVSIFQLPEIDGDLGVLCRPRMSI